MNTCALLWSSAVFTSDDNRGNLLEKRWKKILKKIVQYILLQSTTQTGVRINAAYQITQLHICRPTAIINLRENICVVAELIDGKARIPFKNPLLPDGCRMRFEWLQNAFEMDYSFRIWKMDLNCCASTNFATSVPLVHKLEVRDGQAIFFQASQGTSTIFKYSRCESRSQ